MLGGGTRGKLCFVPGRGGGSTPGPVAKASEVLDAGLSRGKFPAPGDLSMGCLPAGRGQKLCAREMGQRDDEELGLWKLMNMECTLDSARH